MNKYITETKKKNTQLIASNKLGKTLFDFIIS